MVLAQVTIRDLSVGLYLCDKKSCDKTSNRFLPKEKMNINPKLHHTVFISGCKFHSGTFGKNCSLNRVAFIILKTYS